MIYVLETLMALFCARAVCVVLRFPMYLVLFTAQQLSYTWYFSTCGETEAGPKERKKDVM